MAIESPLLADPRVSACHLKPSHNSFNNSTHIPTHTSFHLYHPGMGNSHVGFFIYKSISPSPCSRNFPSPDYGYLQLKSPVEGATDIVIRNIYRSQGTSSFISHFSYPCDFSDFFSAALTLRMCILYSITLSLTLLLTTSYLEILICTTLCGVELKPLLTQWLRVFFLFSMLTSYIFYCPRALSRAHKTAMRPQLTLFSHLYP